MTGAGEGKGIKITVNSQINCSVIHRFHRPITAHDGFSKIRDKVHLLSVQYGKRLSVSKYGTILYFKGRLATPARRKEGLSFSIIYYCRFNHPFCIASVVEEMLENLTTPCLCSKHNPVVYRVVLSEFHCIHTQQQLFWPLCLIQRSFGKFWQHSCRWDVIDVRRNSTLIGCHGTMSHDVASRVQFFQLQAMRRLYSILWCVFVFVKR